MKFCPNCGSPMNGREKCDCGFNINDVKEEPKKEENYLFKEPPYQDMGQFYEPMAFTSIPLEELKRRRLSWGELTSISFDTSGGMEGCYYHKEVDFINLKLTLVDRPHHNAEQRRKVYSANKEIIDKIKKLINENNMSAWKEIPCDRSLIAMDAPTSSFTIRFEDGSVNISTLINMDDEERAIYMEVLDLVNSLKDEKKLISDEEDKEQGFKGIDLNQKGGFCPLCGCFIKEEDKKCIMCGFEKKGIK